MKILVKVRCEDSSLITLPVKGEADARKAAKEMVGKNGVIGCRFRGMSGEKAAIFNVVTKLNRGAHDVPAPVAESLIALKYAVAADAA